MKKELVILAFFVICVPVRIFLVYIAIVNRIVSKSISDESDKAEVENNKDITDKTSKIKLLAIFTFVVAIYWLFISFSGLLSGIWWNPYRIIHAINYLIFSGLVYLEYEYAYIILLLDLLFGITVFILHNYDFISKYVHEHIIEPIQRYSIKIS